LALLQQRISINGRQLAAARAALAMMVVVQQRQQQEVRVQGNGMIAAAEVGAGPKAVWSWFQG
jgi:hypothetical protein